MFQRDVVSEDKRGWILRAYDEQGREFIVIFTKQGGRRGGEYHKTGQHDLIIYGRLLWTWRDVSDRILYTKIQNAGHLDFWPPFRIHMAEALEDTLYVEWLEGSFEKTYDPKLRAEVERRMRELESNS